MRVALAQINATLGDFRGNRLKILDFTKRALSQKCDLVVFPELALMGYLPNDLLERPSIIEAQLSEFEKLIKEIPTGISVVVGLMTKTNRKKGKPYFNSAALLQNGKKPRIFSKQLLPTYDVFDEARHIEHGRIEDGFFTLKGKRILLTICEDIWGWELPDHPTNYLENPLVALKNERVDLVINLSASPFTFQKAVDRRAVVGKTAKNFKAPMIYVNLVGGQDEVVFDGGSFAVDAKGRPIAQSAAFIEDLNVLDLATGEGGFREVASDITERTREALVLGIRDYVLKTGFQRVHFGLSGGIDSALVACLAVDALGPENVVGITLPGPFNDPRSKTLAEELAKNLGIQLYNLEINDAYEAIVATLHKGLGESPFGVVNENIQARVRGLLLMAYSNKMNSLLLTTGNKSEYATGYSTLYGDMCGGLAPIADCLKTDVFALTKRYNKHREIVPDYIITRPPSAELRPDQKDEDSLPPYALLDKGVRNLVECQKPARTPMEKWLLETLMKTEFKRWQAPPILKVSPHSFGRGRRMPIAHRARS